MRLLAQDFHKERNGERPFLSYLRSSMASMMNWTWNLVMATDSRQIENAIKQHELWICSHLPGYPDGIVQLRFEHSLVALGVSQILGPACRPNIPQSAFAKLKENLVRIEFPSGIIPSASLEYRPIFGSGKWYRTEGEPSFQGSVDWRANWMDCPMALWFRGLSEPIVVANVPIHTGGDWHPLEWREIVLAKIQDVTALMALIEDAFGTNRSMEVIGGDKVTFQPISWDDIVMGEDVAQLVRRDFQSFLEQADWYRNHRMAHRRGYLFHGPPGNGKSSVIRAMLSTSGISSYTFNPYREFATGEDPLALLFAEAAKNTPSIVVLEDIDRCFPREPDKELPSKVSLQQLLNHLDGIGNQDGMIVVATANHPNNLDQAILRRPGRFDRVVGFQNPSDDLRARYWKQLYQPLEKADLSESIQLTAGFSFAQLRETYILAGQLALEEDADIGAIHLSAAAQTLSKTMTASDRKWNSTVGYQTQ